MKVEKKKKVLVVDNGGRKEVSIAVCIIEKDLMGSFKGRKKKINIEKEELEWYEGEEKRCPPSW